MTFSIELVVMEVGNIKEMAQKTNRNTTKRQTEVGLKIELSLRKSGYFLFEIESQFFSIPTATRKSPFQTGSMT